MLYLAHFSFTEEPSKDSPEPCYGWFTCVADAADTEKALEEIQRQLTALRRCGKILGTGHAEVRILNVVEVRSTPTVPFVGFYSSTFGDERPFLATELIGVKPGEALAYGWNDGSPGGDGDFEVPAFLTFHAKPKRRT